MIRLLLFCLFVCMGASAQAKFDYTSLDSIARTITYKGDTKILSHELTSRYISETEKARAIFIWVTHNISYDVKSFNKKKGKGFKCNGENCGAKYVQWENQYLERVLDKKLAVCEGYSRVFKRLCDHAGLRTDLIAGYTKNSPSDIGRMGQLNHAWNGILLDGNYYYLDATWAAGGCSYDKKGKLKRFFRGYKDFYWLTPNDKFFRDHFPKDTIYPYAGARAIATYKNQPYICNSSIHEVEILSPATGILEVKNGDTLTICFTSRQLYSKLQVNTNLKRNPSAWVTDEEGDAISKDEKLFAKQSYVDFTREGDRYSFKYIVRDDRLRYIDILADYRRLIRFNVVRKTN